MRAVALCCVAEVPCHSAWLGRATWNRPPSAMLAPEGLSVSGSVCSKTSTWGCAWRVAGGECGSCPGSLSPALSSDSLPASQGTCLAPVGLWDSCLHMEETLSLV